MDEFDTLINEVLGANRVEQLAPVKTFYSTGCTVLDLAIANQLPGGIPGGRITQIYGDNSTAKSVLANAVLGAAQRKGANAFLADIEHTLDPNFAELYGLDCDNKKLILGYPETLEEMFDNWLFNIMDPENKNKKLKGPRICVVDSLTALPAAIEMEKSMTKQGFGAYRAKQISLGLRRNVQPLSATDTTLFIVDQTRENMTGFGGETTTGGKGFKFYASCRIYLQHERVVMNTAEKPIGIWIKFKMAKNKIGPPFRTGYFKLLFDHGIDDIHSNLRFLCEEEHGKEESMKKTGKVTVFGEEKQMKTWIIHIERDNKEEELRQEVYKVWKQVYAPEVRKKRVWK